MALEKFHYTTSDGHDITLPYQQNMPIRLVRQARAADEEDAIWVFLEELLDIEQLHYVGDLTVAEFGAFVTKWHEASEATLGESSAS